MKISKRQQLLVAVAAAVVGLFAADKLLLTPLTASWKARSARIAGLRKNVTEGQALIDRETSLRARWAEMRTNTLPDSRPVAEEQVLKGFDRWSRESRVSILSISPQWKQSQDYLSLECRVEAAGDLSSLSRFLYELEKDPLPLRVQSVELSSRDNEGKQLALGLQVSGLILSAETQGGRR